MCPYKFSAALAMSGSAFHAVNDGNAEDNSSDLLDDLSASIDKHTLQSVQLAKLVECAGFPVAFILQGFQMKNGGT
jgi:hypothetical protein